MTVTRDKEHAASGIHRRKAVESLALSGLFVAAGPRIFGEAFAQQSTSPASPPASAASGTTAGQQTGASATSQTGWRWCSKCEGMFYAKASAGMGHCPAGAAHVDAGSGHYIAVFGEDQPNTQQGGWRWCHKCEGMFYARASAGKGHCPAGAAHEDAGSGHYAVLLGEDAGPKQQGGWRWCHKCEGMFYARASAGKGHCPAGAAHDDAGSGHYAFAIE
jgi:hypothetical protein